MLTSFKQYLAEDAPGVILNPDSVGLNRLKDYFPNEIAGLISRDGHTVYLWVKSLLTFDEVAKHRNIKDLTQYYKFAIKFEHKKAISFTVQKNLSNKDPVYNKIHSLYLRFK